MAERRSKFEAIGTQWDIQVRDTLSDDAWAELMQTIYLRIQAFDKAYSRFRTDSLVTRMSQAAGRYELPPDGYKLLRFYERLYAATNGKVTPLIGQTMVDAGYDATYSFKAKDLHHPPRWEDVLSYDEQQLSLKQPALLDFGAAGKGYLVDIVSKLIEQAGSGSYTINAGGDILHRSPQTPLEIGLENPLDTTEVLGIVQLSNRSLCASAGSKRKWGDFHHIIDPNSLESTSEIMATWVIADDTMTADGLATALFFTAPEVLGRQFEFSYAILDKNGGLGYAKDFPLTLFEAN